MTHLGTQISALADGRLTGAARERALCHVAACAACADELAATRAARRALAAAADVPPAPDLTPRLLALGALAPCRPAGEPQAPAGSARSRLARSAGGTPLGGGPVLGEALGLGSGRFGGSVLDAATAGGRRPPVRSAAVLTVGVAVVGLFLLGEVRDVTPDSHPAADLALLAAAGAQGGASPALATTAGAAGEVAVDARGTSVDDVWPGGQLPDGYVVVATASSATWTELDLDGPAGPVVVLRQPGRLRADVVADVPTLAIGEHEVHVLSDAPWHVVWQSGDAVVGVVAAHRSSAVDEVVAAYPQEQVDDGIGARMSRGWQSVVGAWAP